MRTLITDESKPLNLKTYKSPSSDNTHFSQPCSIARNSNRHISNESLSLSVTTTISQFHQQLTLKPLAPIRYPGIMKKSDKHFPNSRRSELTKPDAERKLQRCANLVHLHAIWTVARN